MAMVDFSKVRAVHFIGVGGIGISAIARMFLLLNKKVSGSDLSGNEVTRNLQKAGADIFIGAVASKVPTVCDLVIYTIAIPEVHPELLEAKRRGIPLISYPEALGIVSRDKFTIAITGTHGKTTTTAMVGKILRDAALDPTVIVGSLIEQGEKVTDKREFDQPPNVILSTEAPYRTNFIMGRSRYLVVEGCEYRRSFLNLYPKILVITNIDADHLDYYGDIAGVEKGFTELAAKVPKDGVVICDLADSRVRRSAAAGQGRVIDFNEYLERTPKLLVPGQHNRKNAAAALAVAEVLGVELAIASFSLTEFRGAARRFEYRGRAKNGAVVYDDYGHHPTEIEATLKGARELFPHQKIIVIFQPHLYSRTKQHLTAFGRSFGEADAVILLPIYPAREQDPGDIDSEMVAREVRRNNRLAAYAATFTAAAQLAEKLSGDADLILTLGAGEANKVADLLIN
jgi:UDP-N-acetylmuramate--alanine ligase